MLFRHLFALLLAVSCWAVSPLQGQAVPSRKAAATAPATTAALARRLQKDQYAQEPVVVERLDTVYRYNADGTGTRMVTETARVQDDAGVRALGVLSFPYASRREHVEVVYVRVQKPGGASIATPPTDAQDTITPMAQVAPQYSDQHVLRIAVRGLAAGDELQYQVRTVVTETWPEAMFWGGERQPGPGRVVLEDSVELHVPASRTVRVSSFGHAVEPTGSGADKVYRWSGAQLHPTVLLKGQGARQPEQAAEDGRLALGWTTFPDWAAVADWYRRQAGAGALSGTPDGSVKGKADEVVYGAQGPEAKVGALYRFVSGEVRSIDVPLGAGRYGAEAPDEVLGNLYGDSQDKSALLAAMLRVEGVPAEVALVSTGGELEDDLPLPGWFSRAVTLVPGAQGRDRWLDTAPEIAPLGMLEPGLRDKPALVLPPTGPGVLTRTPADLPFAEWTKFEGTGTLDAQGALHAHVDMQLRGDEELLYRESLRAAGPAHWDRALESFVRNAGFTGQASNLVSDAGETTDTALHLSYDYNAAPFGDWENFRIVPLEPGLALPFTDSTSSSGREIVLGGKRTETAISRITLPAGLSADLPQPMHVDAPFATLDKTYRLENGADGQVLVTERKFVVKQNRLSAAEWPTYSAFLESARHTEPWVQLISTVAHSGPGHYAPMAGEDSPAAAELIQEAAEAVRRGNWAGAAATLDRAKAANERQALLWSSYADLAFHAGRQDEAANDLREELRNHVAEGQVSRRLAQLLLQGGQTKEAAAVLVAAVRADPDDAQSTRMLVDLQLGTDPAAAEKTARAGLRAAPDSAALKLALAHVLLREGKRDEAGTLLADVVNSSEDAGLLNDAAYELADAGLNLRLAEAAAHRALQLLNGEALRGGNRLTGVAALRRTAQLVSCWDTFGWVLYQEGSYSEAEDWLKAAWMDGFGAEAGRHYAQLLSKEGRAPEAARVQALSGGADRADGASVASASAPGGSGIRGTRRKEGITGTAGSVRSALQGGVAGLEAERTYAVSQPAGGVQGTATFDLDLSLTEPVVVRFVQGNEDLQLVEDGLGHLKTRTFLPPGSVAHVVRRAVVTCGAGANCSVRLLTAREAASE